MEFDPYYDLLDEEEGGVSLLGIEEFEKLDFPLRADYTDHTTDLSSAADGTHTQADVPQGGDYTYLGAYQSPEYSRHIDQTDTHQNVIGDLDQALYPTIPNIFTNRAEVNPFPIQSQTLDAAIPEPFFQESTFYNTATGLVPTEQPHESRSGFDDSISHRRASVVTTSTSAHLSNHVLDEDPELSQWTNMTQITRNGGEQYERIEAENVNPMDDGVPDVMTFLDRWFLHSEMAEIGTVQVDNDRLQTWRAPDDDTLDFSLNMNRDMQFLDWQSLGTDRRSAKTARRIFYPPRNPYENAFNDSVSGQKDYYDFKRIYSNHRARFTHYQLRHVLAATSRNDVFYAAFNKVIRTSLSCPSVADTVVNLSSSSPSLNRATSECHITTIAVSPTSDFAGYCSDSVLVTGGFQGEYSLLNLNSSSSELPVEGFVTNALDGITTHIHTLPARRTGAIAAAFCSNDRKIRVLDVGSNTWLSTFEYPDQPNCAATAPDGRLRVVVGDTRETLITDAEKGNILFSMDNHQDDAFACAWADDGWHVATGAQDGKVMVYDARNWSLPLARLDCEMGCARSLQFTTAGPDAGAGAGSPSLVVAEADDIVSVYDSRDWAVKQTIDFFGSVAGVALLEGGRELLVANGDRTVGGLMLFERNEHGIVHRNRDNGVTESHTRHGKARARKRDMDNTESYWENQPKRLGLDLAQLII